MSAPNTHFLQGREIVIAGAGIAGLAFAIALRKQWNKQHRPPLITIYERDSRDPEANRQGYSLSMNGMDKDGGLVALQQLGLLDKVIEKATPGTAEMPFKMWDGKFEEIFTTSPKPYGTLPTAMLRIARRDLRDILVQAAEELEIDIKWNHICQDAKVLKDAKIQVSISEGNREASFRKTCDLLVAADGAHSKIRSSIRPEDRLQFAKAVQIGGVAQFPEGIPAPVNSAWGLVITGRGHSCFFSPVQGDTVVWALSSAEDEPRRMPKNVSSNEVSELLAEAMQLSQEIEEPFATVVRATDPSTCFIIPAMDKRPFRHESVSPGVVFIGDSNHAVSPFAGNGANTALKDGWDLAESLCRSRSLENVLSAYDSVSLPRATKTLNSSHWRIAVAHCTGVRFIAFRVILTLGRFFMWLFGKG